MDRSEGERRTAQRSADQPETKGSRAWCSRRSVTKRSAEDRRAGELGAQRGRAQGREAARRPARGGGKPGVANRRTVTASPQAPDPSLRRRRQSSLLPLRLLSPPNPRPSPLGFGGGPGSGGAHRAVWPGGGPGESQQTTRAALAIRRRGGCPHPPAGPMRTSAPTKRKGRAAAEPPSVTLFF